MLTPAFFIVWLVGLATAIPNNPGPAVFFTKGQPLDELRGASILAPQGKVADLSLTMSAATLQGPENSTEMLMFTNPMYRDDSTGEFNVFAPTIRIPAGTTMTIKLTNNLTYPTPTLQNNNPNALFHNPFITNMHTHGLHASPGVFKQDPNAPYTGDDNIFYELDPRNANSTESEASYINYTVDVPKFHSPGMFFYHPHYHGSSGLQTVSSNGILIIEDDPEWLPEENGCGPVVETMASAKDVMLHFSIYNFLPPILAFPGANAPLDDTSIPTWSQLSDPKDPLCCGSNATTNTVQGPLLATGSAIKNDTLLVNGGYQPAMTMEANVYQRWRVLHTGYKNWVDIQILNATTKKPTNDCELLLIAKDGIYLKTIPRTVDHIFLASGNRAELFVRCTKPGADYILASGIAPSPFCGANITFTNLIQQEIATIRVVEPSSTSEGAPSTALTPSACTPLRSDYASDLSNESLAAFNATDKLLQQNVSFTFGNQTYGCLVNDKNFTYPDPDPLKMPLGKVVEWPAFLYAAEHPLHTHIVPYQLMRLDSEFLQPGCSFTSWFEAGDWQDTLYLPMTTPSNTSGDSNLVRFQPGPFTGYAVMHCHFLHHEDEGCMKVLEFSCDGANGQQPEQCDYTVPVPGTYNLKKNGGGSDSDSISPSPVPPPSSSASIPSTSLLLVSIGTVAVSMLL